jgi:hypothetical protein
MKLALFFFIHTGHFQATQVATDMSYKMSLFRGNDFVVILWLLSPINGRVVASLDVVHLYYKRFEKK